MRARADGSPCLKEWLVPYFRNAIKCSEGPMWRARGISSFCHSGVGWGSPNFNSLSSMLSFLSDLLCAQRVEPAANVSASGLLSLGGVLSPKEERAQYREQ